jgi:hypothetical protein
MSFWASSYDLWLESLRQRTALCSKWSNAGFVSTTIVRKTRAMFFPGLLFSIESFDAMLGRVPVTKSIKPRPEL